MKYKPTPLNIASVLFIVYAIYLMVYPGPEGWGFLAALYIVFISIIALVIDFFTQLLPIKYYLKFIIETLILIIFLFYWFI
jgi:hypothetical protein